MNKVIKDGSYGTHQRNTLDFYFADENKHSTPLVIYIHGGGFWEGDKSQFNEVDKEKCLNNGISFATINYPFIQHKPLQEILMDIKRAIQYFKYHSDELNIDKDKISCYGVSAGAGSSLFLAAKGDMSDENSKDPVLRESTNVFCAGLYDTQSTYDFYQWVELLNIPVDELISIQEKQFNSPLNLVYGIPIKNAQDFFSYEVIKIRKFLDMCGDLSTGDCPIYIKSSALKQDTTDILHAQVFSQVVYDKCKKLGIPVELTTPEIKSKHNDFIEFLFDML